MERNFLPLLCAASLYPPGAEEVPMLQASMHDKDTRLFDACLFLVFRRIQCRIDFDSELFVVADRANM